MKTAAKTVSSTLYSNVLFLYLLTESKDNLVPDTKAYLNQLQTRAGGT